MQSVQSTERGALIGLGLSIALAAFGTSSANVALPTLGRAFTAPFEVLQWVVLAYLLATTALAVGAGRLGDAFGRRRLLLVGIAVFSLASVACAAAPTLEWLILARGAQGAGAAAMLALPLALVGGTVSKARAGRAIGLLGTLSAIGTALGPSLSGLLIAGPGWPAVFIVALPFGGLAFALVLRAVPADSPPRRNAARIDGVGMALLALGLAGGALAVTLPGDAMSPLRLAAIGTAALAGALFVRREAHSTTPLLGWSTLHLPGARTALAISASVGAVMMTTLVVGPFYLARALDLSPATVGLVMATGPAMTALAGVPAGHLVDHWGASRAVRAGLTGMTAASLALALLAPAFGIAGYVAALAGLTASYAVTQAANTAGLIGAAPAERRGTISGLLTLTRNFGLIAGAAALAAVFAAATGASDVGRAEAEAVTAGFRLAFLVAAGLSLGGALLALAPDRERPVP